MPRDRKSTNRIAVMRNQLGLTQQALAKQCGIALGTLAGVELGESAGSVSTRHKIMRGLGLDPADHEEIFGPLRKLGRPRNT